MKTITVKIDSNEYNLRNENEELVVKTADEVNRHIDSIRQKYKDLSPQKVAVLASLNIAEELVLAREQYEKERNYLLSEIDKMSEYIKEYLSSFHNNN